MRCHTRRAVATQRRQLVHVPRRRYSGEDPNIPDFGLASAWLGSARVRRALHVGNLSMAWGGAAALGDQVRSAPAPPLGRLPRPSLVRQYALPAVSLSPTPLPPPS